MNAKLLLPQKIIDSTPHSCHESARGAGRLSPRFPIHGVYFSLTCDSIPEVVMLSAKKKPEVG